MNVAFGSCAILLSNLVRTLDEDGWTILKGWFPLIDNFDNEVVAQRCNVCHQLVAFTHEGKLLLK